MAGLKSAEIVFPAKRGFVYGKDEKLTPHLHKTSQLNSSTNLQTFIIHPDFFLLGRSIFVSKILESAFYTVVSDPKKQINVWIATHHCFIKKIGSHFNLVTFKDCSFREENVFFY